MAGVLQRPGHDILAELTSEERKEVMEGVVYSAEIDARLLVFQGLWSLISDPGCLFQSLVEFIGLRVIYRLKMCSITTSVKATVIQLFSFNLKLCL